MTSLATPSNKRLVLFPIEHDNLYQYYKKHVSTFWTVEEIDLSKDSHDWENKLDQDERDFVLNILGFFAASDGLVMENLVNNFCSEITLPEARHFYAIQNFIESIHSETYSLMIDKFAGSEEKKHQLFNAVENHQSTKKKAEWALEHMEEKWRDTEKDIARRLVAFACVEGIMFSSSFCALYWLKKKGVCPGLTFSNELISKDEGLHRDFACELFRMSKGASLLKDQEILEIVKEAVEVEQEFVKEILPYDLPAMNKKLMCEYVAYVADHLLVQLGKKKFYNTPNPFPFMDMISLEAKTNFFEKRVSEYSLSSVTDQRIIAFDEDF